MKILNKQIAFISVWNKKLIAALILGAFLSMLIIFLEPFNTNEYESNYRTLSLLGFGAILALTFFIQSSLENQWYAHLNKVWLVQHELISVLLFFIVSGTLIFLYNHLIINGDPYSLSSHWWYYSHIVIAMIPIVAPLLIYLRQKFGECIPPPLPNTITFIGENKNEILELQKTNVLFIQAIENYIEINYLDVDKNLKSKTFRQTLTKIQIQNPFLEKCHRSYLVHCNNIKEIKGNSQRAKIHFENVEVNIPLSKTFYKNLKRKLD